MVKKTKKHTRKKRNSRKLKGGLFGLFDSSNSKVSPPPPPANNNCSSPALEKAFDNLNSAFWYLNKAIYFTASAAVLGVTHVIHNRNNLINNNNNNNNNNNSGPSQNTTNQSDIDDRLNPDNYLSNESGQELQSFSPGNSSNRNNSSPYPDTEPDTDTDTNNAPGGIVFHNQNIRPNADVAPPTPSTKEQVINMANEALEYSNQVLRKISQINLSDLTTAASQTAETVLQMANQSKAIASDIIEKIQKSSTGNVKMMAQQARKVDELALKATKLASKLGQQIVRGGKIIIKKKTRKTRKLRK
jgi:hypothetical protein